MDTANRALPCPALVLPSSNCTICNRRLQARVPLHCALCCTCGMFGELKVSNFSFIVPIDIHIRWGNNLMTSLTITVSNGLQSFSKLSYIMKGWFLGSFFKFWFWNSCLQTYRDRTPAGSCFGAAPWWLDTQQRTQVQKVKKFILETGRCHVIISWHHLPRVCGESKDTGSSFWIVGVLRKKAQTSSQDYLVLVACVSIERLNNLAHLPGSVYDVSFLRVLEIRPVVESS